MAAHPGHGRHDPIRGRIDPEDLEWDDDLRSQARAYLQSYRRALDSSDPQTRATLLAMDTLMIGDFIVLGWPTSPTHRRALSRLIAPGH